MSRSPETPKASGARKRGGFLSVLTEMGMTDQERVARALEELFERVAKLEAAK